MAKRPNPYEAKRQAALKRRKQLPGPIVKQRYYPRPLIKAPKENNFADFSPAVGYQDFLTTNPTSNLVNGIQVGDNYYQRNGNKIAMKSLRVMGYISNIATSVQQWGRVLIILDKTPAGAAAPALTDIIQSRDQVGTASNTITSGVNIDKRDRYVLLRDYKILLPAVTNTAGVLTNLGQYDANKSFSFDEFIDLRQYGVMNYVSTSSPITTANIQSNAIYLFVLAETDNKWRFTYRARFKFCEM